MEKLAVTEVKESLSLPQIRELHELTCEIVSQSLDYSAFADPAKGEKALGRMLTILEAEPQRKLPKRAERIRNAGPNGDSAADLLGDAIGMLRNLSTYSGDHEGLRKGVEEVIGVLRELEVIDKGCTCNESCSIHD